jgi:DNA-binding SARP family transcriptional activator
VLALEQTASQGGPPAPAASAYAPSAQATPQVVFDYFAGEIFGRMEREAQALLLRAAFLPSMAAHRVVELTGIAHADRVLGELARSNYFTLKLSQIQGAPPATYQFHPLFREFLLRRAQETLAAEALREVRLKAAGLLEADGETGDAVALLLSAHAWQEAMGVMFRHAPDMLQQGRGRVLDAWLRALPDPEREQSAWAQYWLGRCRLAYGPAEARAHFERAFDRFEAEQDAPGLFAAWASIVDSYIYERGDFAPLDRWIAVLDRLLGQHPRPPGTRMDAGIEARVACGMFTALMYRQPHRLDLPDWAARARSIALESTDTRMRMLLGNQLVHYYTGWLGDLANARLLIEALRPSPAEAELAGPLAHVARCAMEAKYYWYVGEPEECLRVAKDGMQTMRRYGATFSSLLETHGVYAHLTTGDVDAAEQLLKEAAATTSGGRLHRAQGHFLAFLCAFHRDDMPLALAYSREAVALVDGAGVPLAAGIYRTALALALFRSGKRREAHACLAQARRIARQIRSPNVEFSCAYALTYFLLERGKTRFAIPLLRRTLGTARERRYLNRLFWTPEVVTRLLTAALEHGIETDYVQEAIRKRRMLPPAELAHLESWPFPVKIHTLGRFGILLDGKPLEFAGKAQRKPLELLMALIAFGGRDVSERQLTEALWPEAEGDAAHQACAVALHRLRKLLRCDAAVTLQNNQLGLDPRRVWIDAWAFERALSAGDSPRAVDLYQGSFLARQLDLSWAIPMRERLRVKFMRHLADRGHALFEAGEVRAAVSLFEQGLGVDPLAEEFYRQLMVCYQALDRRSEAIGVYQRCEKVLAASLGVSPAAKTLALYRSLQS